jgi:hypothetical protein
MRKFPGLRPAQPDPDAQLLDRIRSGDEHAFAILVQQYRVSMQRVATGYVPKPRRSRPWTRHDSTPPEIGRPRPSTGWICLRTG